MLQTKHDMRKVANEEPLYDSRINIQEYLEWGKEDEKGNVIVNNHLHLN